MLISHATEILKRIMLMALLTTVTNLKVRTVA